MAKIVHLYLNFGTLLSFNILRKTSKGLKKHKIKMKGESIFFFQKAGSGYVGKRNVLH
jgi:hypothetical protein